MDCCCVEHGKIHKIEIVIGDSFKKFYQFIGCNGEKLTDTEVNKVIFSVGRIAYSQEMTYDEENLGWHLSIPSSEFVDKKRMLTTYDITVYFNNEEVRTEIYNNPFALLEKSNKVVSE